MLYRAVSAWAAESAMQPGKRWSTRFTAFLYCKTRGGWPRLIMHTQRDDVITAIDQDVRDRLEVIFKQLGLPGKATAV